MALTHAELAAKLAVEGCLGVIAGAPKGTAPMDGVELTPEEVAKLGLEPGRPVMLYPAGETGVFVSMHPSKMVVWFNQADCDKATGILDASLKRAYPAARQLDDRVHPYDASLRVRVYEVDVGSNRMATLETAYPGPDTPPQDSKFVIRVDAKQRTAR